MCCYLCSYFICYLECCGKDVEIICCLCEKFCVYLMIIVNFVEGLCFIEEKKCEMCFFYYNLLLLKVVGIVMVFNVFGLQFDKLLNVMLCYLDNYIRLFYDMLSGCLMCIVVCINLVFIGEELYGDYVNDKNFKCGFQCWLNGLWEEKDCQLIDIMRDKEWQLL